MSEKSVPPDAPDVPDAHDGVSDDPAFAALLKRSLDVDAGAGLPGGEQRLLTNVQRKLRERSRGKFYGDGWSTASARVNYVLIALVMLAMVLVAYLALGPTGIVR